MDTIIFNVRSKLTNRCVVYSYDGAMAPQADVIVIFKNLLSEICYHLLTTLKFITHIL